MSAGSFWPSPSMGTRMSPRARSRPAESAAVWPALWRRNATRTCSGSDSWMLASFAREPSVEPSSTKMTSYRSPDALSVASNSAWSGPTFWTSL